MFPDRWSGDACLTAWGGEDHTYSGNTCLTSSIYPQGFDADVEGNTCTFNYSDPVTAPFLPTLADNLYSTPTGQFQTGCSGEFSLSDLEALGQERGSRVQKGYNVEDIVLQAQKMLGLA